MKKIIVLLLTFFIPLLYAMEIPPIEVKTYAYSVQGKIRDHCEDTYTIKKIIYNNNKYLCTGIFDGHSGDAVAKLAQKKFFTFFEQKLQVNSSVEECLKYACDQCENYAKKQKYENAGSTVLASCFNCNTNTLSVLWLGDSRAYVSNSFNNTIMTKDHNCTNEQERQRVEKAGGKIEDNRLSYIISVTRSLGDAFLKTKIPQLIAEHECISWNASTISDEGNFINYGFSIEASDGFWNVYDKTKDSINNFLWDAKNLLHKEFYERYNQKNSNDDLGDLVSDDDEEDHEINIAQRLCYIAEYLGSGDDTTVIVKLFGDDPFLREEYDNNSHENSEELSDLIDSLLQKLNFDQANNLQIKKQQKKDDSPNDSKSREDEIHEDELNEEHLVFEDSDKVDEQKKDDQKNQELPKLVPSINKNYKYFFGGMVGIILIVLFLHYYYKQLNEKMYTLQSI